MYDFIDKSNPGRLLYKDKDFIFNQIEKALKVMRTKNLRSIQDLIIGLVWFILLISQVLLNLL